MLCTTVMNGNDYRRCELALDEVGLKPGDMTPLGRFAGICLDSRNAYLLIATADGRLQRLTTQTYKHRCAQQTA